MDHFLEQLDESYNFTLVDKKIDYLKSMGAEPIFCLSYMPDFLRCRNDTDMRAAPKNFSGWGQVSGSLFLSLAPTLSQLPRLGQFVERVVHHLNVEKLYGIKYFEVRILLEHVLCKASY